MVSPEQEEKLCKEAREAIIHLTTGCSLFLHQKKLKPQKTQNDELKVSTIREKDHGI